ncbi:hypothetical protein GGR53DRAFT_203857 [Hypoxylon sp. FL1150]|nr:hypothetical protein GGR53DRAFT_203857 [Hypoxylon sp. FL1150]
MASLPAVALLLVLLLAAPSCRAHQPGTDAAVPADFPQAFVKAMVVAIICLIILMVIVCVFAHCAQCIIGLRRRPGTTGFSSSATSRAPERWLEPVFEWPQQQTPRRSRNNMKRRRRQRQGLGGARRRGAIGKRAARDQGGKRYNLVRGWA